MAKARYGHRPASPVKETVMPSKPPVRRPVYVTGGGGSTAGLTAAPMSSLGARSPYRRSAKARPRRLAACRLRISLGSSSRGSSIYGPRCQPETSGRLWLCDPPVERAWADRACHPGRVGSISERGPVPLRQRSPHGTHRAGLARPFASHPVRLSGMATSPDADAVSRSPMSAHVHTAPTSSSPSPA